MNILIVACGDTGVTLKVAAKLKQLLVGASVDIVDGKDKLNLSGYDEYVLGTNIHFGKFNKRFYKALKVLRKSGKSPYVYISGAEIEKKESYEKSMTKEAPEAKCVRFVWGELHSDAVRGFKKFAIESFFKGRKDDGLPIPKLLDKEIKALARQIIESK